MTKGKKHPQGVIGIFSEGSVCSGTESCGGREKWPGYESKPHSEARAAEPGGLGGLQPPQFLTFARRHFAHTIGSPNPVLPPLLRGAL